MALFSAEPATENVGKAYPELAVRINRACAPLHDQLNGLITDALPLALPPKAKDTRLYAAGLASFGMIYLTFEEMWDEVTSSMETSSSDDEKVKQFLATLRPKGIERSPRLRQDLKYLRTSDDDAVMPRLLAEGPAERAFRRHIQQTSISKPHNLYAYAWCMYMAIFAGGRYVREDLAKAGEEFWRHHGYSRNPHSLGGKQVDLDRLGYSFLSFDGKDDGFAIEQSFRSKLDGAEMLFSSKEQDEVVEESKAIFNLTIDLVKEMGERIKPELEEQGESPLSPSPYSSEGYAEKISMEGDNLLTLEADEEEVRAWREAPLKRDFWFWLKLASLCLGMLVVSYAALIWARFYAWKLLGYDGWYTNKHHASHGWEG